MSPNPQDIFWKYNYDQLKNLKQYVIAQIRNAMSSISPVQTDWEYVNYESYGGSASTPFLEISVGLTGGTLSIQKKGLSQPYKLRCGSLDGGFGIGLTPFNINFPGGLPDMPSGGIIFRIPSVLPYEDFSINCFRGMYATFTQSASVAHTSGLCYTFYGSKISPKSIDSALIDHAPKIIMTSSILIVSVSSSWSIPEINGTISVGVSV